MEPIDMYVVTKWSLFIKKITVAYQVKEQNYSLNDFPSVKYNPWVSCWGWPLSSVCTLLFKSFTGVPTSSRRYLWRRHLDSQKWRQTGHGENFSNRIVVVVENGGPSASGRHLGWPHFWVTRNQVIRDGGRKRKGRHFLPQPKGGRKVLLILLISYWNLAKIISRVFQVISNILSVALCLVF